MDNKNYGIINILAREKWLTLSMVGIREGIPHIAFGDFRAVAYYKYCFFYVARREGLRWENDGAIVRRYMRTGQVV